MRRVHEQSGCAGALARRFVDSVLGSACSGWCGCRMSVWAGCFDFAGLNLPGGISCLGGGGAAVGVCVFGLVRLRNFSIGWQSCLGGCFCVGAGVVGFAIGFCRSGLVYGCLRDGSV